MSIASRNVNMSITHVQVSYGQSPPGIQQEVGKELLKDKLDAQHP